MNSFTARQALYIHAQLVAETGGEHGVQDLSRLEGALSWPFASFSGGDLYPNLFYKAAALLKSILQNHPFSDGNHRTAIMTAALFLRIGGYRLCASEDDLIEFIHQVSQKELSLAQMAEWLQRCSQAVEDTCLHDWRKP